MRRPANGSSHLLIVALAALLVLAVATPVAAQDLLSWVARPAPGGGERTTGAFNLSVTAGTSLSDGVEIFNLADASLTFNVYAADVLPTAGGGLAPSPRDAAITGPGAWIQVDQVQVEVSPKASVIVTFTVSVPDDAPRGEHTAALLVEPEDGAGNGAIVSRTRVGLWVNMTVTGMAGGGAFLGPWILILSLLGLLLIAVLLYVTRGPGRRWIEAWRVEERPRELSARRSPRVPRRAHR